MTTPEFIFLFLFIFSLFLLSSFLIPLYFFHLIMLNFPLKINLIFHLSLIISFYSLYFVFKKSNSPYSYFLNLFKYSLFRNLVLKNIDCFQVNDYFKKQNLTLQNDYFFYLFIFIDLIIINYVD
jgi:hypothetical protein